MIASADEHAAPHPARQPIPLLGALKRAEAQPHLPTTERRTKIHCHTTCPWWPDAAPTSVGPPGSRHTALTQPWKK
jgi:hypothetical protein